MCPEVLDLANQLKELGALVERVPDLDDFLDAGLKWLAEVTPYDLATVWQVDGDILKVRTAQGRLTSRKVLAHQVNLGAHQDLKRVLQDRVARVNTEHDHRDGDGDLFDHVLDLTPGHSCMVVPLYAGDQTLGLLSLDRNVCETYSSEVMRLVDLYAHILALGMLVTAQAGKLSSLYREEKALTELLLKDRDGDDPVALLGRTLSPALRAIVEQAKAVATTDSAVLIRGETGSGKEVLATALHRWSRRRDKPLLKVNCASIPAGTLESELFGHVKGAFTGAVRDRDGRFRAANGGTIFLDEIGDMPLELQAKLLRVLQEGAFEPVGSDQTIKVDVRLLAATNVDLEDAIRKKTFREDLYYRINVFPLTLPPLRDRLEDLPALIDAFLEALRRRDGGKPLKVGKVGLDSLRAYGWPGNVRELRNVLERAVILARGRGAVDVASFLTLAPLSPGRGAPTAANSPVTTLDEATRVHIKRALEAAGGKIYGSDGAAQLLGLKPSTLQSKMKKLKIK